jgi:hypothetical protein
MSAGRLTEAEVAAYRKRHQVNPDPESSFAGECQSCAGIGWPCDAYTLLGHIAFLDDANDILSVVLDAQKTTIAEKDAQIAALTATINHCG